MNVRWRYIPSQGWSLYSPEEACCVLYCWEWFDDHTYLHEVMGMAKFDDIFGGAGKAESDLVFEDQSFAEKFPTLYLLLASSEVVNGKRRKTCTLTIVAEDGVVKCGLKERDRNLSLWTSSESVGGVFTALEEALGERPVKWRRVEWHGRK